MNGIARRSGDGYKLDRRYTDPLMFVQEYLYRINDTGEVARGRIVGQIGHPVGWIRELRRHVPPPGLLGPAISNGPSIRPAIEAWLEYWAPRPEFPLPEPPPGHPDAGQ